MGRLTQPFLQKRRNCEAVQRVKFYQQEQILGDGHEEYYRGH